MTPEVFSTQQLPPSDQFSGWRDWCLPLVDVTSEVPALGGYHAENQVWRLGDGMLASQATAPAARTVRSPRLIRHLPVDHWVVTYQLQGAASVETPRGAIRVEPGQSYVWSLGQVSSCRRSKICRADLLLSRDTFRDIAPLLDAATGSLLDTRFGQFLGDFVLKLLNRLPHFSDSDVSHLTTAVSKLIAACVAPSAERVEAGRSLLNVGRLERVRQTVRTHLQSPLLGPQMLCRQVGMSRSNLYRLLESEGGVTAYIQRHRLTEARNRLADSKNTQPIASMAQDLCFNDSSSFGRAFRTMFGISPGELRMASFEPNAVHAVPPARSTPACTHFSDMLRWR